MDKARSDRKMIADARKVVKSFSVLTFCLVYTSRGFRLKQNIKKQNKQGYKRNKKRKPEITQAAISNVSR